MRKRQLTAPLLVRDGHTRILDRVAFEDRFIDEGRLQSLLFEHPQAMEP
ncbi:hypothetical protein ACERK3_07990 [Phycisphaerales bacterium AB-hyl4]|uniref:Uncharacterized protein n=1 Tax=Natronomicrosphaera hydrolytica TaxID=3242702 RepID=A0ABV4U3Q8_9BACT